MSNNDGPVEKKSYVFDTKWFEQMLRQDFNEQSIWGKPGSDNKYTFNIQRAEPKSDDRASVEPALVGRKVVAVETIPARVTLVLDNGMCLSFGTCGYGCELEITIE